MNAVEEAHPRSKLQHEACEFCWMSLDLFTQDALSTTADPCGHEQIEMCKP